MKIGFVSDIHEDILMLKHTINVMEKIQVDEIVCLGDFIGYSIPYYSYMKERDANAVIDIIRSTCSATVVGNHDLYAIKKIPDNNTFFEYPENWYELNFFKRKEISNGRIHLYEDNELSSLLTDDNKEFIFNLPEKIIKKCEDHCILFTHYAMPDCTGSSTWIPKEPMELIDHYQFMDKNNCLYGFSGNDHVEGVEIFTCHQRKPYSFESIVLNEKAWIHGPAIARGTTQNGFMVYDSISKVLSVVSLESKKHVIPYKI